MKKYLSIILTVFLATGILTGCAGKTPLSGQNKLHGQNSLPEQEIISEKNNVYEQSGISGDNMFDSTAKTGSIPDNVFSKEDYQKISALQFDGYGDMAVSDYRSRIAKLTDTAEYSDLLQRVSDSEILYGLKDTDETAYFLYYVLEPLTGEKWKSRDYSGCAVSGFPYPEDNAMLEYVFTLTILNADTLTVREYDTIRLNVISSMQDIIDGKTKEELQDENSSAMSTALQTDTDNLIRQLQTEEIGISVEYAYFPLSTQSSDHEKESLDSMEEQEKRMYTNGTEEDYRSLLALKRPDYQNMTLADFNSALLKWTNENRERMERISEDTGWNDFQVDLTDEELSFVKWTVSLSGMENGKAIQNIYTGTQDYTPCYDENLPQKILNEKEQENGRTAWCSLYYRFFYSISEPEAVTVGERDRQIRSTVNAIQTFWNDTDIECVLKMSEGDIVEELERIAAAYSTDKITITTNEENIHFECMDERKYAD